MRISVINCLLAGLLCISSCHTGPSDDINRVYPQEYPKAVQIGYYFLKGDVKNVCRKNYFDRFAIQDGLITDIQEYSSCTDDFFTPEQYNNRSEHIDNSRHKEIYEYDKYARQTYYHSLYSDYAVTTVYEDSAYEGYVTRYYDDSGNKSVNRFKQYDYDGNGRKTVEYDSEGNICEEWHIEKNETIAIIYMDGEKAEEYHYNWDGDITEKYVYDNGIKTLVYKTEYKPNETIHTNYDRHTITTEFFESDMVSPFKTYTTDLDGKFIEEELNDYDEYGNSVLSISRDDSEVRRRRNVWSYDNKGNWILQVRYLDDHLDYIGTREISYYDGTDSKQQLMDALAPYLNSPSANDHESNLSRNDNENSYGGTINVQHHGAAQVWVPCGACGGSGLCPLCHGTGHGSLSDGSCLSCGYTGRCSFCAGQGGHYEMRMY